MLDRIALRAQASEADALAEIDRTRTALLAAVGHDLRTPLAAAKAAISTLRSVDLDLGRGRPRRAGRHRRRVARPARRADREPARHEPAAGRGDGGRAPAGRGRRGRGPGPRRRRDAGVSGQGRRAGRLPAVLRRPRPAGAGAGQPRAERDPVRARRPPAAAHRRRHRRSTSSSASSTSGPGIPRSSATQVFLPFQRLGDTDNTTGVGLGLALSRGLTEAMGGTLEPRTPPAAD